MFLDSVHLAYSLTPKVDIKNNITVENTLREPYYYYPHTHIITWTYTHRFFLSIFPFVCVNEKESWIEDESVQISKMEGK